MMTPVWLSYPEDFEQSAFLAQLQSQFPYDGEQQRRIKLTVFDTFDWRLWRKGLKLTAADGRLDLASLTGEEVLLSIDFQHSGQRFFYWDLPDSELRRELRSTCAMRALLPLATLKIRERILSVLNQDDKIVARIGFEEISPAGKLGSESVCLVRITPLRGYPDAAQRLVRFFEKNGFSQTGYDLYQTALEMGGRVPGDYDNKMRLQLDSEERADVALSKILLFQLEVMRANEAGVVEDIDSEFLHDLRVAVRRSRSALSQLKQIFAPEEIAPFRKTLRDFGQRTNLLRDMDVYLLQQENYLSRVPSGLQKGLQPLFRKLRRERARAHAQVVSLLTSNEYRDFVEQWKNYLEHSPEERGYGKHGHKPTKKLVDKRIAAKFRQIVDSGQEALHNGEEEYLHRLRIECKKLRYLLEFFQSLYPAEEMPLLIHQLKRLQDNLGLFNDLTLQIEYLDDYARKLRPGKRAGNLPVLAAGCLIGSLHAEKLRTMQKFSRLFEEFSGAENRRRFKILFGKKKS